MAEEINRIHIKNSLRWFSNLTGKEQDGVKDKFEDTINKRVYELTVEDIYNIYIAFFGMQ